MWLKRQDELTNCFYISTLIQFQIYTIFPCAICLSSSHSVGVTYLCRLRTSIVERAMLVHYLLICRQIKAQHKVNMKSGTFSRLHFQIIIHFYIALLKKINPLPACFPCLASQLALHHISSTKAVFFIFDQKSLQLSIQGA